MSNARKPIRAVAGTTADATLPKTPITIDGKTYNLCFDLGALAEAEMAINRELARRDPPQFVNLLMALPVQNLANTRTVFAAAVRTFHSELTFDEAMALLTLENVHDAALAIRDAWDKATPKAKPADPLPAGK